MNPTGFLLFWDHLPTVPYEKTQAQLWVGEEHVAI